jgi:hypothetical protein
MRASPWTRVAAVCQTVGWLAGLIAAVCALALFVSWLTRENSHPVPSLYLLAVGWTFYISVSLSLLLLLMAILFRGVGWLIGVMQSVQQ